MTQTAIQEIGVGIFVIFMMITVGLDLTWARVIDVFRHPAALIRGLGLNYIVMPALALCLVTVLEVPPLWAAGILIGAMAPGGPVGPVLAQRAGGHVPLAVSLAVVMNTSNTIATPLLVWATNAVPVEPGNDMPVAGMIRTIVLFQLVPLALAMTWRHIRPEVAKRQHAIVARAARVVMGSAVAGLAVMHFEKIAEVPLSAGLALLSCIFSSLLLGWWFGGRNRAKRISLSLTAGIRSMSVALLLVAAWFPRPETMMAALAYSCSMFAITWAFAEVLAGRGAAEE